MFNSSTKKDHNLIGDIILKILKKLKKILKLQVKILVEKKATDTLKVAEVQEVLILVWILLL